MEVQSSDDKLIQREYSNFSQLEEALEQKEENLWKALLEAGVSKEEFFRFKAECGWHFLAVGCEKIKAKEAVSQKIYNFIVPIIREFGLNPADINIICDNKLHCQAAVGYNFLLINEDLFKRSSEKENKFIIAHELQHFKYQDNLMTDIVCYLLSMQEKEKEIRHFDLMGRIINPFFMRNHPYLQLCRFQEERADIKGALKNKEYAKCFLVATKELFEKNIRFADLEYTHPSLHKRLAMAQNIINTYNNQPRNSYNFKSLMIKNKEDAIVDS
jgi:hypothetical protein